MKFRIRNKRQLRSAYEWLHVIERFDDYHSKVALNQLKVAIRNYNKMPVDSRIVQDDGADGYVKLIYMPRYFDNLDKDEVKKYFEEHYVLGRPNSMYDCTGQAFTSWFTVVRRGGRWVVYHSISFDY